MSYWLRPLKKDAHDYDIGAFSWPMILNETGACYLLDYGQNTINPGTYFYCKGNNGSSVSNDGYKVTASQAKCLAKIFRGYVFVKNCILTEWDKLSEEQRAWHRDNFPKNVPPGKEFLDKIEKLAAFCEQSGGFRIR